MPVTYADVKEKRLGREANIEREANLKLENELANEENNVIAQEAQISQQGEQENSIDIEAQDALSQMERISQEGGDVEAFINTLDPAVQERVITIINGSNEESGESEQINQQEQGFQPLQAPQQPVPVTQSAQQIAQF